MSYRMLIMILQLSIVHLNTDSRYDLHRYPELSIIWLSARTAQSCWELAPAAADSLSSDNWPQFGTLELI